MDAEQIKKIWAGPPEKYVAYFKEKKEKAKRTDEPKSIVNNPLFMPDPPGKRYAPTKEGRRIYKRCREMGLSITKTAEQLDMEPRTLTGMVRRGVFDEASPGKP